jgi:hypothetical protein
MEFLQALKEKTQALCWVGAGSSLSEFWADSSEMLVAELEAFARMRAG